MPVRRVARMARRPAGPSGLRSGPAGLTAKMGGLFKSRGEAFQPVFFHSSSSPRLPPSPWPPPPQASPPPSLSTQPIPSKLRSGVDRVVLKLSTERSSRFVNRIGRSGLVLIFLCTMSSGKSFLSSPSSSPCLTLGLFMLLYE
jgi:hypothetical protein